MVSSKFVQEIDDVTHCCICTELYTSPKALPCLHTICLKCLETYTLTMETSADKYTCPICRRKFTVQHGGLPQLPGHFFIEKLVDVRKGSSSNEMMCDLCTDEADVNKVAKWNCANCGEKPCSNCCKVHQKSRTTKMPRSSRLETNKRNNCCKAHQKSRMTKMHQVVEIGDQQTEQLLQNKPNFCDQHPNREVEFYCEDCRKMISVNCCFLEHVTHNTLGIIGIMSAADRFVNDYRSTLTLL